MRMTAFLFFVITMGLMPDVIVAGTIDSEIEIIQKLCSRHGENVRKAYLESKKHIESLSFSAQLGLWLELNKQITQHKGQPFATVAVQLSLDFLDNRERLTGDDFLVILQTISDKNISSKQRIALMGWLLIHRAGYIDTSYMEEGLYHRAHGVFKKIAANSDAPVDIRIEAIRNLELLTHNQLVVALRRYPEGAERLKAREEIGEIVAERSLRDKADISMRIDKIEDILNIFKNILSEGNIDPKIKTVLLRTLVKLKKLSVEKREAIDRVMEKNEKSPRVGGE